MPFVIEGLEHSYDTKDSLPDESMHNSHELLYLREGKIDLIFGNVRILDSTSKSTTFEKLFRITDKDVMIGISFPRYSTMAVDAMNFAHERGAEVVAITDSMISPLVTNADEVLLARSDIASVVDTLVAPLSLINALLVAVVIERKDEIIGTFSELEKVWQEQNVYARDDTGDKEGGADA